VGGVLGVRLDPKTEQKLEALAAQQGRTKSDIVREAIRRYLEQDHFLEEARRQSLLVSATPDDRDAAELAHQIADWGDPA
jgi:RHH-type transcriptional regulator, rel operon repressor / antitoxin RelB